MKKINYESRGVVSRMKAYNILITLMLMLISVLSIKNLYTGHWDLQYSLLNGGMAIIVLGIFTAYTQSLKEQSN
ncbi:MULTISPECIES: hypothetical protein [Bacillaceae]|uniref:hypothetical protein n=2 Tax=Bacillales TaxID=1385 RepID=UPI0015849BF3|nr:MULTISPECIES: hypothetical protein [Bacillaceae]